MNLIFRVSVRSQPLLTRFLVIYFCRAAFTARLRGSRQRRSRKPAKQAAAWQGNESQLYYMVVERGNMREGLLVAASKR